MISYRQLTASDHEMLRSFYGRGIAELENKEFFYNFQDGELLEALRTGYFIGAFEGTELIASAGIDHDRDYGDNIRQKIIKNFSIIMPASFFEVCGLFVDRRYRGKGLASSLLNSLISHFATGSPENSALYSIVQIQNDRSINNFFKHGFYSMAMIIAKGWPVSVCMARLPLEFMDTRPVIVRSDDTGRQLECMQAGYAACSLLPDGSKVYKRVLQK